MRGIVKHVTQAHRMHQVGAPSLHPPLNNGTRVLPLTLGHAVTGTATDTQGNTSEFGPNAGTVTLSSMRPSR